jgi:hypothetical protein
MLLSQVTGSEHFQQNFIQVENIKLAVKPCAYIYSPTAVHWRLLDILTLPILGSKDMQ